MKARSQTRALVIGMGGIGCPAAVTLASAGVGLLTLVDPDKVDVTNLHRQPLYGERDVGRFKVDAAASRLSRQFPSVSVVAHQTQVGGTNAESLFAAHDVVIDGTDQVATKLLLSDVAVRTGVPLVYGGVIGVAGQAMAIVPGGACLRCLFEEPPDAMPSCAQAGVLGSVAGLVGALCGVLGVRILEGTVPPGYGELLRVDGRVLATRTVRVPRAADCPACSAAMRSSAPFMARALP